MNTQPPSVKSCDLNDIPYLNSPEPIGNDRLSSADRKLCEQFEKALNEKDYTSQINCFHTLTQRSVSDIDSLLANSNFSYNLDSILDLVKSVSEFRDKKCNEQNEINSQENRYFKITKAVNGNRYSGLSLQSSGISLKDVEVVFKIYEKTVKCLDISEFHMCSFPLLDGIEIKLYHLLQNSRFKVDSIKFHQCQITDQMLSAIAPVLSEFNVSQLDIITESLITKQADLAQLLRNTSLRNLCLSGVPLGNKGVAKIAEALKGNTSLQWLYLCDVGMDDKGFIHLASALEHNTSLQYLGLPKCKLDNNIVPTLQGLLKTRSSVLRELDLGYNNLDTLGIKRICQIFYKMNPSNFTLELKGNGFSPFMWAEWKRVTALLEEKNSQAQSL